MIPEQQNFDNSECRNESVTASTDVLTETYVMCHIQQ
jgi:hypothetical protein